MPESLSLVVVDDERIIRDSLSAILGAQDGITVAGTAEDGEQAVELCAKLRPDVVLLDIRMPRRDGLWAVAELGRRSLLGPGRTQALILTTFDADEYVDQALASGAAGFILKNSSYEELTAAVRNTADGHMTLSPSITQRIVASHLTARREPDAGELARIGELTPREIETLKLVGDGLSNTDIADTLVVSVHTVKTHVSRILTKTGCTSRAQLAVLANRVLT